MYHKIIKGVDVISSCSTLHLEFDHADLNLRKGQWVSNPSEELIFAEGWEVYVPPTPPAPSREEQINAEIRAKYTDNDEYMILRQYLANPSNPAYAEAFSEYNEYVESVLAKYPEPNE